MCIYNNGEIWKERNSTRKILCCKKAYSNFGCYCWYYTVDISKLVKKKSNSKYLNGYLDKTIRPLVLEMPKMIGYVKTFKVKERNNKLMSFPLDDEKLLEKV